MEARLVARGGFGFTVTSILEELGGSAGFEEVASLYASRLGLSYWEALVALLEDVLREPRVEVDPLNCWLRLR